MNRLLIAVRFAQTMDRVAIALALVVGLVLGGGVVMVWLGPRLAEGPKVAASNIGDLTTMRSGSLSTSELAQTLMTRVSRELGLAASPEQPMRDGVTLYGQPTAWGDFLCEVRAYRFPARILRGRPSKQDRNSEPTLEIEPMYVVSREPSQVASPGARAHACGTNIDPRQLIHGDALDVERAARMLTRAVAQARRGALPFEVTCIDARSPPKDAACDGMDLLRRASAREIRQVMPDEEDETTPGVRAPNWSQKVFLNAAAFGDGCGQRETLTFDIVHGPLRTSENLHGIAIRRDIIC